MTASVSGTNSSALQQVMLLLQQLAQQNAANQNNSQNTNTTSVNAASSATTNLVSGSPSISGDLLVLLQGQSVSPSGAPSAEVGQQDGFGQDYAQLIQAIQSGNLTAAQQAYSALSQIIGNANDSSGTNPFLQALDQIGSDLQSGDITGAQQTLSSLQETTGHHHGGDLAATGSGGSGSDAASSNASTTITSEVTSINPDGSTTTLITYADGSTSVTTTPAPSQNASA